MTKSKALLAALVSLGSTALVVLAIGEPASAAPHTGSATSVQIGYTDSANRRTAYDWQEGVDLPLGARLDESGVKHKSRIYATYDLTPFHGKNISGGTVRIQERSAADCTKRAIELWQTRTISATPSWSTAPDEVRLLDSIDTPEFCPTALIAFDVFEVVRDAIARGRTRITFELRVPDQHEGDVSYGRTLNWFATVRLSVRYNTSPTVQADSLTNGGRPCATRAPYPVLGFFASKLQALGADADEGDAFRVGYEFAVWPVSDPAARTVVNVSPTAPNIYGTADLPDGTLTDGVTYAWQVRTNDGADTSAWSKTCKFVVDRTPPPAPQVTSSNYPPYPEQTPLGEPGRFTFSGGGNTDVFGFAYSWDMTGVPGCNLVPGGRLECDDPFGAGSTLPRADVPGGSANVTINPPRPSLNMLLVQAVDRAGNRSAPVEYELFVPWSDPQVSVVGGEPRWGEPVTLKFTPYPGVSGVTSYEYQLDFGQAQTITAGPDGTATITFTVTNEFGHQISVRSRSANGFVSTPGGWSVNFDPWPGVSSDVYRQTGGPVGGVGVPGTFTFTPPPGPQWLQIGGYRYQFGESEPQFVSAGPNRDATITWAPTASGYTTLEVYAVRADGTLGDISNFYDFFVA
jgi:hypothetical protein